MRASQGLRRGLRKNSRGCGSRCLPDLREKAGLPWVNTRVRGGERRRIGGIAGMGAPFSIPSRRELERGGGEEASLVP